MKFNRFLIGAAIVGVGMLPTVQSAFASCASAFANGAVWHFHAMEAGADVGGASVIRCVATFADAGNFSAPKCKVFAVGDSVVKTRDVSGKLNLTAACDFTGSIDILGGSDPNVIIKYGHINGSVGSGTGIQGTGMNTQVVHFNLVKK